MCVWPVRGILPAPEPADERTMQYLFAFLFMAAFAVGTGALASSKGYNAVLWSMIGLFLGIIGLLIALVLPKRKPAFQ
jgi:hypothetical protein